MALQLVVSFRPGAKQAIAKRVKSGSQQLGNRFRAAIYDLNCEWPDLPGPEDEPYLVPPAFSGHARMVQGTGYRLIYNCSKRGPRIWGVYP